MKKYLTWKTAAILVAALVFFTWAINDLFEYREDYTVRVYRSLEGKDLSKLATEEICGYKFFDADISDAQAKYIRESVRAECAKRQQK